MTILYKHYVIFRTYSHPNCFIVHRPQHKIVVVNITNLAEESQNNQQLLSILQTQYRTTVIIKTEKFQFYLVFIKLRARENRTLKHIWNRKEWEI